MHVTRYDILSEGWHWLLTDGRSAPRRFLSSTEAVQVALSESRDRAATAEIYVWRESKPERVYPATLAEE